MSRNPRPIRAAALLLLSLTALPLLAQESEEPVAPAVRAEEKALVGMEDLEATMNRLATLLERTEPENAARLREAYEKAREAFIRRDMARVLAYFRLQDLEKGLSTHQGVTGALEELLQFLLTGQLDPEQIRRELERLRRIDKALGELKETEEGLEQQTSEAEEAGEEERYADLARQQAETQEETDALAGEMAKGGELGGETPGTAETKEAAGSMQEAGSSLSQGKGSDAQGCQSRAGESLAEAQKKVQEEIDRLEAQAQEQVLVALEQQLREMLERQRQLTAQTRDLHLRARGEETPSRTVRLEIRQTARDEDGLETEAGQTVTLLEEEGTTEVFPATLEIVQSDLQEVVKLLEEAVTGPRTHRVQRDVEEALEDLVDALQKEIAARRSSGKPGGT